MKSIKAKLILLGAVSIVCTIILGITGIYIMNNSTANSRVLNDINSINVHQKENSNAELSFLLDYDISHYDTVEENLNAMLEAVDDAISCGGDQTYVEKLNSISSDIGKAISNTTRLKEMFEYRGFKAEDGLYDAYTSRDEEIAEHISQMAQESEWIDGEWQSVNLSEGNSTTVNGKSYKKVVYAEEIPVYAKRNTLVMRIGAYGATYSGKIYITDIRFDNVTVDLAKVSLDVLMSSYGDALEGIQVSEFQGNDCIEINSSFINNNGAWQETLIYVDISGHDYADCDSLTCVMYFEDEEKAKFSVALCLDGKYDIETNFEELNKKFEEYSSLIAEGKEVEKYAADNKALMSEMIAKAPLYTMYTDIAEELAAALTDKSDAMDRITEYDKSIMALMTENSMANESLSQYAEEVKAQIENIAETQKKAMSVAIYLVFATGAVLVIILTVFVILSVQKSINQFEGTLGLITDGDITIKARTDNRNEFDTFGSALNNMTDKLSEVMGDTSSCAAQLNSAGRELENMSKSCENISEQLELSISGIAKGANEQAVDVETSTGEISRLGTLMDSMNVDIKELDATAMDMKQAGKGAMGILDELGSSNEHMTECIGKIEEQITKTNDSVKDIENAVALISSIADQTNLLSLNASIEAARAGEAGRGFAVVASEIQQLAEQSNNSANTVFGVISNLIEDFKEILEIMKEVKEATSQQNDKLLQTQKQFETFNLGITQSRDKTSVIRNAINECSNACASVSKIMMNLSAISEENAASTTEAATAMQNLNGTITTLLQEARKLLSLSAKLDDGIKFFKLDGKS